VKRLLVVCLILILSGCGEWMSQFQPRSVPAKDQDRWERCKRIIQYRQCQGSLHISSCLDRIYSPYIDMSTEQRKVHLKRYGCPPYMVD